MLRHKTDCFPQTSVIHFNAYAEILDVNLNVAVGQQFKGP